LKRLWLIYLILIFGLSSVPGSAKGDLDTPFLMDKVAHFFVYFGFGVVFARGNAAGRSALAFLLMVAATSALVGLADEFYQGFIPGRNQEVADWFADLGGGFCGGLLGTFRFRNAGRRASEEDV
jgi:VanZ family protein